MKRNRSPRDVRIERTMRKTARNLPGVITAVTPKATVKMYSVRLITIAKTPVIYNVKTLGNQDFAVGDGVLIGFAEQRMKQPYILGLTYNRDQSSSGGQNSTIGVWDESSFDDGSIFS